MLLRPRLPWVVPAFHASRRPSVHFAKATICVSGNGFTPPALSSRSIMFALLFPRPAPRHGGIVGAEVIATEERAGVRVDVHDALLLARLELPAQLRLLDFGWRVPSIPRATQEL